MINYLLEQSKSLNQITTLSYLSKYFDISKYIISYFLLISAVNNNAVENETSSQKDIRLIKKTDFLTFFISILECY